MLLDSLENSIVMPRQGLRKLDKLAATMMFLKIGVKFTSLAAVFGVDRTTIGEWFRETIKALAEVSKDGIVWWDRDTIKVE